MLHRKLEGHIKGFSVWAQCGALWILSLGSVAVGSFRCTSPVVDVLPDLPTNCVVRPTVPDDDLR